MLRRVGHLVEPTESPTVCRDPNDDYLLALATAGGADYLVTRDEDLLVLEQFDETRIIYPAAFLAYAARRVREDITRLVSA